MTEYRRQGFPAAYLQARLFRTAELDQADGSIKIIHYFMHRMFRRYGM